MNRFLKVVGLVAFLIMLTNVIGYSNPTLKHFNDRHYKRLFDKGLDVYGLDVTCRDSADMELLKRVCDTVYLMVGPDHYNIRVSREGLKELQEHDFIVTPLAKCYASGDDLGENQVSSSPTGVAKIDTTLRETLFYEDFEGDWEDTWSAWDALDQADGADYWGATTAKYPGAGPLKSKTPFHSLWCSENGDLSAPGPYASWMSSYLRLKQAVTDMVLYKDVQLEFWVWHDLEDGGFDEMNVRWSADTAVDWDPLVSINGSYPMWDKIEESFPILDSAYLEFHFLSGLNDYGWGGVYIDDIAVTGRPLPNLQVHKPWDWGDTIVVSNRIGTHVNTTLYGGEPMYVDFAVINNGPGPSGPFHVGLFEEVDFEGEWLVHSAYVPGLQPGEDATFEDILVSYYSDDMVDLHIRVDYVGDMIGEVQESIEFDNHSLKQLLIMIPQTTISGFIRYVVPNWPVDDTLPAGMIPVEIWDEEENNDTLLKTVYTNGDGQFETNTIYNNDESDMLDIYLRPLATNAAATVYTSIEQNSVYRVQNETIQDLPSEHLPMDISIAKNSASPFFIIAALREGYDKWGEIRNTVPGNLGVIVNNGPTGYSSEHSLLQVTDGGGIVPQPDLWDRDIILHEYAHFLGDEYKFLRMGGGAHGWDNPCPNQGFASSEGFAHFYSCLVRDDPVVREWWVDSSRYFYDLESGIFGVEGGEHDTVSDSGYLWEGACAGAFWDMYDWPDDDFNGDGYGDVLSLTPEFILGFVVDSLPTQYGGRVDSLYGLWYNWMRTNIDDQPQLDSVYREHGMSCCVGMTGNVNGDLLDATDVSDITALVNHLFVTFEPLLCPAEANTSGDSEGGVDISDLTALANYLMAKSRSLPECQ